jgi:hypothetical protein
VHIPRKSFLSCLELFSPCLLSFGATALALNLIPVIGLLFNLTSTIGGALWASKLERTERKVGREYEEQVKVEIEMPVM